jgi:hypothetical protein
MTIIEFYKKLSKILTDTRENFISNEDAKSKLEDLLIEAEKSNLSVDVSTEILDPINLMRLDDEKSFSDESDDVSFDSDYETSF